MQRFTLEPGGWYAAELISEEMGGAIRSHSPIRVDRISSRSNRAFTLDFFHANYPEGVMDKSYELETVERNRFFILAKSLKHKPTRYLLIYAITADWLRKHFGVGIDPSEDVSGWLERTYSR